MTASRTPLLDRINRREEAQKRPEAKAEFVPVWRRPREGRGIARDLTGSLVA